MSKEEDEEEGHGIMGTSRPLLAGFLVPAMSGALKVEREAQDHRAASDDLFHRTRDMIAKLLVSWSFERLAQQR